LRFVRENEFPSSTDSKVAIFVTVL